MEIPIAEILLEKQLYTMYKPYKSLLTFLSMTFALVVATTFASAQYHTVLTLTGKKSGVIEGGSTQTAKILTITDASEIMAITRSNLSRYSKNSIAITKQVDAASPILLQAYNAKEVIPRLTITMYKPDDNTKYKVVTLENVNISGLTVKKTTKDPNSRPVATQKSNSTSDNEQISFTYQKISIAYFANGSTSAYDDWNQNNN